MLYPYKKRFGTKRSINLNHDGNLRIDVTVLQNHSDVEADREFKYITYFLNNITALKENEKYKNLCVPRINLEFDLSSADFLTFEAAELILNETQIVEVEDRTFPETKKGKKDKKEEKK
jgi:hypothetical protein